MNLNSPSFIWICRGLLVLGIFLVYPPLLSYGWLQIEDGSYYLRNPLLGEVPLINRVIGSWSQAPESNWIPLTWMLAISIESVFGLSATAFHLCSVILHTVNALLVFRLVQKLKLSTIQALFVASLFALHPLQVESIAWASSLKGVLSAMFALILLNVHLDKDFRYKSLCLTLLFGLCLLSKQTLIALPLVIVLLSNTSFTELLKESKNRWPLFLLSIAGGLAAMLANHDHPNVYPIDHFWEYPLRGFMAIGHYTQNIFIPVGLHPEYTFDPSSWSTAILGLLIFLGAIGLYVKNSKYLLTFVILLFPILGWLPSPLELAADRLVYFPLIFTLLGLSGLFIYIKNPKIAVLLILLLSIGLGVMSNQQLTIWRSDESLCNHTLKHAQKHFLAKLNLGLLHAREGNFQKAEEILRENTIEHPHRIEPLLSLSQVLLANQKKEAAINVVKEAVENHPSDSRFHLLLAQTYRDANYPDLATKSYNKAMELDTDPLAAKILINKATKK